MRGYKSGRLSAQELLDKNVAAIQASKNKSGDTEGDTGASASRNYYESAEVDDNDFAKPDTAGVIEMIDGKKLATPLSISEYNEQYPVNGQPATNNVINADTPGVVEMINGKRLNQALSINQYNQQYPLQ